MVVPGIQQNTAIVGSEGGPFGLEEGSIFQIFSIMTRGNQRDRDRERAQARSGKGAKVKDDGLTPEQRRERDAKALQEKAAKKAAGAGGTNDAEKKNEKASKK